MTPLTRALAALSRNLQTPELPRPVVRKAVAVVPKPTGRCTCPRFQPCPAHGDYSLTLTD